MESFESWLTGHFNRPCPGRFLTTPAPLALRALRFCFMNATNTPPKKTRSQASAAANQAFASSLVARLAKRVTTARNSGPDHGSHGAHSRPTGTTQRDHPKGRQLARQGLEFPDRRSLARRTWLDRSVSVSGPQREALTTLHMQTQRRHAEAGAKLAAATLPAAADLEGSHHAIAADHFADMKPTPLVYATELHGPIGNSVLHAEPHNDGVRISGTEFVSAVAQPVIDGLTAPALLQWPLSPMLWASAGIANAISLYEQYRILEMVFEWIPSVPATTAGTICGACDSDVHSNALLSGVLSSNSVREIMMRPGSEMVSIWKNAAFDVLFPQQQWYYVSDSDEPNLSVPGVFNLMLASTSNSGLATGLGYVVCHYTFELRSMKLSSGITMTAAPGTVVVQANTGARNAGNGVVLNGTTYPALTADNVIVAGVLSGFVDGAVSVGTTTSWRKWSYPDSPNPVLLAAGMVIYFRQFTRNGVPNVYPYFNLGDAMSAFDETSAAIYHEAFTTTAISTATLYSTWAMLVPNSAQ